MANFGQTHSVGVDEIIGAAVAQVMGASDVDDQLAEILSADVDIVGAVKKALAAGSARRVVSRAPESADKTEFLPIPATTLNAGESRQVTVTATRAQRLDRIEFDSSNLDHQFVTISGIDIAGKNQSNGNGGIRMSHLSELRTDNTMQGNTVQANAPIALTVTNTDAVNPRTFWGLMSGPTA